MWFYFAGFVHFKSPLEVVLGNLNWELFWEFSSWESAWVDWEEMHYGMSEKLGWAFKWMFLVCSRRSGTGHCFKSLSDHKTVQIQVQVVSVSSAEWLGFCCSSALLFELAVRAGLCPACRSQAVPQEENWESSQGKQEQDRVQTLPGLCKYDWGDPWRVQHMDGCSAVRHD